MPSPPAEPLIAILGPTASGKSALALALAERLDGEIVSADALQVYRGLDIGTAKPTPEERRRVPHHLVDVLDPEERWSAGEFARRAREAIGEIRGRGRRPLVVGGSGLYLKALLEGISPVPPGEPRVRAELERRLASEGLAALYAELERRDPPTAARLAPGDSQRILRALEVERVSGVPLSRWLRRQPFGDQRLPAIRLQLTLERRILYDRIRERVEKMLARGWVEEVESLLSRGSSPDAPAFQAIGYRQLARHLAGEWLLEEAIEDIVKETRRFAKRQETWFRKEPEVVRLDARDPERLLSEALVELNRRGIGRA